MVYHMPEYLELQANVGQPINARPCQSHTSEDHRNALQDSLRLLRVIRQNAGQFNARADTAADSLEVLLRSYLEPPQENPIPGLKVTKCEYRIIMRLIQAKGATVTRPQIMDAMYFDRANEEPMEKIVDVLLVRIRKKLQPTRWRVVTIWGQGYQMTEEQPC